MDPNVAQEQPPAPQPAPQPAPEPVDKKNTIQERISKLYGQLQEERENRTTLSAENEQLRTQLLTVQEEINALKAATSPSTPFGAPAAVTHSGDADIKKAVAEAVREVVGPIDESLKQMRTERAMEALRAQQIQSLQRAVAEFPELQDPNSELFQAADQILRRDKALALDPTGPQRAVYMARGLLSDRAASAAPLPQQRAAAATPSVGTGPAPSSKPADVEALKTELEEARKQSRDAVEDYARQQAWQRIRSLRTRIAQMEAQGKN